MILSSAQDPSHRRTRTGTAERTLTLAVLRGALLDLLATGNRARTSSAVASHVASLQANVR
jgi:hypothetical protein